jgi:hypothetical protein
MATDLPTRPARSPRGALVASPTPKPTWAFAARFRRGAFGWRDEPALTRIKEAVSEIKAAVRKDPVLGAEGAVLFLQKVSPALQNVDGSSGAVGTAVRRAIEALAPIIAKAQVDTAVRRKWLEKLFEAHGDDDPPYIESLGDFWGDLCAGPELADEWADRLVGTVESVWSVGPGQYAFFHGTSICLSAMHAAGRHEALLALLAKERHPSWFHRQWGVKSLLALGRKAEALRYAEESRGLNEPDTLIAQACEDILLSSGMVEEAYRQFAMQAHRGSTYLATYKAVCRKYPGRDSQAILSDLIGTTPGDEGKWFAAAKDAGLLEMAIDLARRSPTDHRTLLRAAKDLAASDPGFAAECGFIALHWISAGKAYDPTGTDVLDAYDAMLLQTNAARLAKVRLMIEQSGNARWLKEVLSARKELWEVMPAEGLVSNPDLWR